jgi:hypothetical protein
MIKKIIINKMFSFYIVVSLVVFFLIYVYGSNKQSDIMKKFKGKDCVNCFVLLYGTEKLFPGYVYAYNILYDKRFNIIKVIFVDTETVVLSKKEKTKSLKDLFNEAQKKNIDIAVKNFYLDLQKIFEDMAPCDFYFNISFEMLDNITWKNEHLRFIISKNYFENEDLKSINHLKTIECLMHIMPYAVVKIYRNYNLIDTNIPKLSFISSALRLKFFNPILLFCVMPVKYIRGRIEPDKQNIKEFLNKLSRVSLVENTNLKNVKIRIKNTFKKSRIAEKITWLLRANKFDVLDWDNFFITYDKTLIKDHKCNFLQDLRIAKILKIGKIIISYDKKFYYDVSIFIGKDFTFV